METLEGRGERVFAWFGRRRYVHDVIDSFNCDLGDDIYGGTWYTSFTLETLLRIRLLSEKIPV